MAIPELSIEEGYNEACSQLGDALVKLSLLSKHSPKSAEDFYEPKHLRPEPRELSLEEMMGMQSRPGVKEEPRTDPEPSADPYWE